MPLYRSAGQLPGTATNDNAASGNLGEYIASTTVNDSGSTAPKNATITVTIAAPAVVTWTAHPFIGSPSLTCFHAINFTNSGGALPTGITASTTYYVSVVDANTLKLSTTLANAIAGTYITTTGSQSGTHTGRAAAAMASATATDLAAISLTAGDWDVWGEVIAAGTGGTTTQSLNIGWINSASATIPSYPNGGAIFRSNEAVPAGGTGQTPVGMLRVSLSSTTTIYLSTHVTFAVSTLEAYGFLGARRRR